MAQNIQVPPPHQWNPPNVVLLRSYEEDTSEYDEFRPSWDVPPLPTIRYLFPSFIHKTVQAALISLTLTSYVSWSLLKSVFLPLDDPSGSGSSVKRSSQEPRGPRSVASRRVARSEKYVVKPYFRQHELAESASTGFGYFRTVFTRLASIWVVYKSYVLVNERLKSLSESPSALPSLGFFFDLFLILVVVVVVLVVAANAEQSEREFRLRARLVLKKRVA